MPLRATAVSGERDVRSRPLDPALLLRAALDARRPGPYEDRDRAGPDTEPEPAEPEILGALAC